MGLQKKIGYGILTLLVMNAIIGTGVFFTPGIAAGIAGPASLISWVLAGIMAVVISLCFAELSSMFPKAGGIYEYAKRAFGDSVGFLVGWTGWIVANITIAMLVVGGTQYLGAILELTYIQRLVIGLIFIGIVSYLSFRGIDVSAKVMTIFAIITISILGIVIYLGSFHINLSNLTPFFVKEHKSIFIAMFYIIETFIGWETISFLGEETKNPKENIPKALIWGTVGVILLVIMVVFISLATVHWSVLSQSSSPIIEVIKASIGSEHTAMLTVLIILNIWGGAAAWIITTPRLIFAMARENDLPVELSETHEEHLTPHKAIALQAVLSSLILISGTYKFLLEVLLPLSVFIYGMVILGILKLRLERPNKERKYKVPLAWITIIVTVGALVALTALGGELTQVMLGGVLIVLGIPLYLLAGLEYRERIIKKMHNLFAFLSYKTYNFFTKKAVREHLIEYLDDVTVSEVLDMGCGIGMATSEVCEVLPVDGMIYGVDFSEKSLKIARKIKKNKDIHNIKYYNEDIYNLDENEELSSKLKDLDAIIGVGILEYLPRIGEALETVNERLKRGGKFYFISFDYFGRIFDKPWIGENSSIKRLLSKHGLKAKVFRERGLFWDYVHIYGKKKEEKN